MNSVRKPKILSILKKSNLKRFSLFIAIAFVFLIFSKLSNDYKHSIQLELSLNNIEDEVIVELDSSHTIELIVEAKGFALIPYLFNNLKTINLDAKADIKTTANQYIFNVKDSKFFIEEQLGSPYKIRSMKPDVIEIPYAKRAYKFIPIILNKNVEYATGFDVIGHYKLNVDSVKIVGPSNKIDTIRTINTETLTLTNVNSSINETIAINAIKDIEIFPMQITVNAEVKRFTEGVIEVPVTLKEKPKHIDINYFPKTVMVSYYVDLERYDSISSKDFVVECNFKDIKDVQTFFVPKVTKKPDFVKRVHIKQKRIDFIKL